MAVKTGGGRNDWIEFTSGEAVLLFNVENERVLVTGNFPVPLTRKNVADLWRWLDRVEILTR